MPKVEPHITVSSHEYHTLDGIRGVAALMIVLRHTGYYFGELTFTESYLAVDLFFVLSGFVIAEAYNKRLAGGLSPIEFMRIRLIRLYPLYLLGTVLGIIHLTGVMLVGRNSDNLTAFELAANASLAILMLPSPFSPLLYPINGLSWSLLFELFSNFLYAIFHPILTTGRLLVVIIISSIGLGICVYKVGNLDAGFYWKDFIVGIPRVLYSFGAGLLIQRMQKGFAPHLPSWLLVVFVFVILSLDPPAQLRPWFDIIAVTILFPAIVYVAAASQPTSLLATKCYTLLGATSYAIYVLHFPLSKLIAVAFRRITTFEIAEFAPFSGIILLCGLILFTWWVDRNYDLPVRRIATKYFSK